MSYSGTVRCGYCYEKGHNRTGCPEMKKAWEENPNSYYGRQWADIQARKKKAKTCSYCDTKGHTRAGCAEMKRHKSQFQFELSLWRRAVLKWAKDTGFGIGALVRAPRSSYRRNGQYMYPGDEDYIPAAGMIMHNTPGVLLTHYQGINTTTEWTNSNTPFASFDVMGIKDPGYYGKSITLNIPCIPGIVPQYAERKNYYGDVSHYDREDYAGNTVCWEIVSPAVKDFNSEWAGAKELKKITKEHFKGNVEQAHSFHCFTDFQRDQLQKYVNGEIELSEMSDPELSPEDS